MSRRAVAVLRPEPGNAATAARLTGEGLVALRLPLFAVAPLRWTPPPPGEHDGLLLTSANTVRHGGSGLASLGTLPVLAVGDATADAARRAGFVVTVTGDGDAARLIDFARARGFARLLHLGGRDRRPGDADIVTRALGVYAADPVPIASDALRTLAGTVALLHSPRAAARLAMLLPSPDVRAGIRVAALSAPVAEAAGAGWGTVAVADRPTEPAAVALAAALAAALAD